VADFKQNYFQRRTKPKGPRSNNRITSPDVQVIGSDGQNLGILNTNDADALFVSCTALPALEILDEVEKKINKPVFSSNQTLIWDTIRSVGYKNSVTGYGKLLRI